MSCAEIREIKISETTETENKKQWFSHNQRHNNIQKTTMAVSTTIYEHKTLCEKETISNIGATQLKYFITSRSIIY